MADVLGQFQQQGERHLRDRSGPIGRDVGDRDTSFACGRDVHDVVAGGQNADVFEFWQPVDLLASENGFVGQNEFGISGAFDHFVGRSSIVNLAISERLQSVPAQITGVQSKAIQDDDFHCPILTMDGLENEHCF